MIKFYKHKDIDLFKWDECIDSSINRRVQAFSWYLNVVANNSWDALVLDDYNAVLPLPYRFKYGFKYIYMPYFIQSLGCFLKDKKDFSLFEDFANYLPGNIKFIDYNLQHNIKLVCDNKFVLTKKMNQVLDINNDYTKIFNSFNSSNKKNIKRSSFYNLKFEKNTSSLNADDFVTFFKTHLSSSLGFSKKDYACLIDLIKVSVSKGKGVVYVTKKENTILNSAFLLLDNKRVYLIASASSKEGKNKKASFFMLNELIKNYCSNFNILDFCGSNIKGIYDYNKGFGASDKFYYNTKISKLRFPFSILKPI